MKREIKLRVWDKIKKKFVDNDYTFVMFLSGKFDVEEENGEVGKLFERDTDDFVVMQYTGLKDKNGKEIYEGDILLNTWKGKNQKVEVYWQEAEVSPGGEGYEDLEGYQSLLGRWYFRTTEKMNYALYSGQFEIIGNIYENPELNK